MARAATSRRSRPPAISRRRSWLNRLASGPRREPGARFPQVVASALAAHLARWPAHPTFGLIFTNERGAPLQEHPFAAAWATARGRADVPEWATPHDLRHCYASALIRGGASVKVLQARLGHASAKRSLDTYGDLFRDEEDRTRDVIDRALGDDADKLRTEEAHGS